MSRSSSSGNDEPDELRLDLRVHCMAVPSPLHFPRLVASTSVGELKSMVQAALESSGVRSGRERMRVIYRGRYQTDDSEALASVFGPETVRCYMIHHSMDNC
jgi:hypothetical protein